jgi:hypothetical protein
MSMPRIMRNGKNPEFTQLTYGSRFWHLRVFRVSLLGFQVYAFGDAEALRPILNDEAAIFTMPVPAFRVLMGPFTLMDKKEIHVPWVGGWVGPGQTGSAGAVGASHGRLGGGARAGGL